MDSRRDGHPPRWDHLPPELLVEVAQHVQERSAMHCTCAAWAGAIAAAATELSTTDRALHGPRLARYVRLQRLSVHFDWVGQRWHAGRPSWLAALCALATAPWLPWLQRRLLGGGASPAGSALAGIASLTHLECWGMPRGSFPDWVLPLQQLRQLHLFWGDGVTDVAVPPGISALAHLTHLHLEAGELRPLPSSLAALPSLRELVLCESLHTVADLETAELLPAGLAALTLLDVACCRAAVHEHCVPSLRDLRVGAWHADGLEEFRCISRLAALTSLGVDSAPGCCTCEYVLPWDAMPPEDLAPLLECTGLRRLDLTSWPAEALPAELTRLGDLRELIAPNLFGLSDALLLALPRLERLHTTWHALRTGTRDALVARGVEVSLEGCLEDAVWFQQMEEAAAEEAEAVAGWMEADAHLEEDPHGQWQWAMEGADASDGDSFGAGEGSDWSNGVEDLSDDGGGDF